MKKKLFLLLCALLTMIGVQAQKDVTSLYITNATLSNGTNGWTKTHTKTKTTSDPADAFSTSVRGNNTVGYATEAYAGWGELIQTAYSMKQTVTLPAGNYRLVCYAFFRQGDAVDEAHNTKSLASLKAGGESVPLKTLRSIEAASYANNQAEGANCFDSKMYRNVVEFTSDGSPIEIGIEGTFDEMRSWCIVGQFELFDLNDLASASSPTDVTYAITNSGFEYRNLSNWTNNVTVGNNHYASDDHFDPNRAGLGYYETWTSSGGGGKLGNAGTFTQTLANMPAGLYELSVYAQNIEQGNGNAGGTGMFVTANSDQTVIGVAGQYKVRTTLATDGDLTIGIKFDNCSGNWAAFDRFGLLFYGDPLDAYRELLEGAATAAQTLHDSGTLPTTVAAELQTAIDENNKPDEYTTGDECNTAISNVESATTAAESCVAPYAEYNKLRTAVQALYDVDAYEELVENAHTTLGTALSTAATNVAAAEDADDIESVTATMKTAAITYAGNANPTNEAKPFDLTFMLTNPDVSDYWTGAWGVKPDGWYTDHSDGNFQVMANEDMGPGGEVFMEYWSESAKTSGFCLNQKVTLDEGTYRMTGRVGLMQDTGGNNAKMTFSANETDGTQIVVGSLANQEVEFVNTSNNTEVKVGIKAHTGNTYRWIGINKIKLYKIPAKTYTVDEDDAWDYSTSGAGDVTLNRTIKVGVNTLVLPFSMTQSEVESKFGEGSKVYQLVSYDSKTDNISFTSREGIAPNEPCLLKATVAGTSYELEGRTIVNAASDAPTATGTNVSLIGSYDASIYVPQDENSYIISGGVIYQVDSEVTLRNTRAYIAINTNSGGRQLILNLDENPTIINAIEAAEAAGEGLKDGKFLIEGKLVIVKNGVKYGANGQKLN